MIQTNSKLSIRRQCQLLHVNRSSLYYVPSKPDASEIEAKEAIMRRIDYWHMTCPYMGSRKITKMLEGEGYAVYRKKVQQYMQEMGISDIYPKVNLSRRNFKEATVPYLLRDFHAYLPNQVWSIDITYIPMAHGHMYLTAIIDWYSRKIVGHYLSDVLDTDSVIRAVRLAIEKYGIPAILNSDQGSQFTSAAYKEELKKYGIRQSMDGKRRWADNIMIERWFRSFKIEQIYPNEYKTPRELRRLVNSYIAEYNGIRPHEALEYETPDSYYYGSFKPKEA